MIQDWVLQAHHLKMKRSLKGKWEHTPKKVLEPRGSDVTEARRKRSLAGTTTVK